MPVALTPLWQLEHVPVMPSWVNPVAGFHARVLWHMPHSEAVAMCVADLPGALIPSWQLEQVPCTCAWSTRTAGFHAVTAWQASQVDDVNRWPAFLPAAFTPSWQLAQPDAIPACEKVAGVQDSVAWHVPHSPVVGM